MLLWAARGATIAAVSVACYLTLTPDPTSTGGLPDWAGHLGVFAGVGASFALLRRASRWPAWHLAVLALAIVFLGTVTEAGQALVGRDPDGVDLLCDFAGGLSALFVTDLVIAAGTQSPGAARR